jgi:hypothetical protein
MNFFSVLNKIFSFRNDDSRDLEFGWMHPECQQMWTKLGFIKFENTNLQSEYVKRFYAWWKFVYSFIKDSSWISYSSISKKIASKRNEKGKITISN